MVALWLYSCAQIVAPTGGDEDTDPPVLDTLNSTPNFQTNFTKQDIILEFDEWIELKNVNDQVLISPFMEKKDYKISIKNKSVVFSFDKEAALKEDLTYIINFGEAVVDFTAGNPVPNMRFVFSTGSEIDSMSISGSVVDALTGNPVNKAVVVLHDNLADTAVTDVKPLYVIRSDKDGKFRLDNLKADTFQVFALMESINNYKLDPLESIGFIDSMVILDTNAIAPLKIVLSKPTPEFKTNNSKQNEFGKIAIGFNQPSMDVTISADPPRDRFHSTAKEDSVFIWYNDTDTSSWNLYLEKDTSFYDTILVASNRLKMDIDLDLKSADELNEGPVKVNPFESFFLNYNFPIHQIDSTKIVLKQDSIDLPIPFSIMKDPKDHRRLSISKIFKQGKGYQLTFFPDALISIHNSPNDTLIYDLEIKTIEDLTNFELNITGLDSTLNYVYKLAIKGGDKILEEKSILGDTSLLLKYPKLDPSDLEATVILDRNNNGVWDSGDYKTKTQPEQIKTKRFEKFLPNFDRTEEWNLSDLKE